MSYKVGQWMFNHTDDGAWMTGEYYDTKEEAIEAARNYYLPEDCQTLYVGQIDDDIVNVRVDASRILEDISSNVYDEVGEVAEDYLSYVKPEDESVLEERLNEVMDNWMKEFGYSPSFFKINYVEKIENK